VWWVYGILAAAHIRNVEITLIKVIHFLKNIFQKRTKADSLCVLHKQVISRSEHVISRKLISPNALKVLYRLRDAGFSAYLVGGCVRDLLLGREPKDFDVVTNAEPEQVHKLFRSALLIGRRFRLVHVRFYGEVIEVATFRQSNFVPDDDDHLNEHGMLLRDNQYGTLDDDVIRRDFTVNALYYNIADFSVVDFMTGMQDLQAGILRIIGEPLTRLREDPVRILRAIRFAAKLSFSIEPATVAAISQTAGLLAHVAPARLFDELTKLLSAGYGEATFALLRHYNVLKYLFPMTEKVLGDPVLHQEVDCFLLTMLRNTDERIAQDKGVNPAFMLAALLWYPRQKLTQELLHEGLVPVAAHEQAANQVINQQIKHIAIPRRFTNTMREIWQMQYQLEKRRPNRAIALVYMHRFRAGYDFLLLRTSVEPHLTEVAAWWTSFYDADEETRQSMVQALDKPKRRRPAGKKKSTIATASPDAS